MTDEKVREDRLRRMATRQRLILHKSRRRDPRAYDFGRYWLLDERTRFIKVGGDAGLTLDEVERALVEDDERERKKETT